MLPQVSTIYQRRLEKLGIATVGDLLLHSPRRHEDLAEISPVRQLQAGGSYTIRARVDKASMRHVQGDLRRTVTEALLVDESGDSVKALWFNARWVVRDLVPGSEFIFSGPVKRGRGNYGVAMMAPDYERGEGGIHTARLVPVYPETRGVSSKWLRRRIKDALPAAGRMSDDVPEAIAAAHGLPPFSKAIHDNHFPGSGADAAAAQRRLAFGQLLANQLEVQLRRQRRLEHAAPPIPYDVDEAVRARDALPFQLTEGQRRAAHQVFKDMDSDRPMARLVLGDVGSGKTVVAAMAATMAAKAGRQTLLMAPTELLARQHARSLEQLGP
ncbi:MAG: ATP-dependent helicase RecG, partial [Chloroflexota bacterium]|nr:ATP-dependent helicase RecG [Chloroflexota bacterium]